jgi:hypothetical protein
VPKHHQPLIEAAHLFRGAVHTVKVQLALVQFAQRFADLLDQFVHSIGRSSFLHALVVGRITVKFRLFSCHPTEACADHRPETHR